MRVHLLQSLSGATDLTGHFYVLAFSFFTFLYVCVSCVAVSLLRYCSGCEYTITLTLTSQGDILLPHLMY